MSTSFTAVRRNLLQTQEERRMSGRVILKEWVVVRGEKGVICTGEMQSRHPK
jgi:hypothetical protein